MIGMCADARKRPALCLDHSYEPRRQADYKQVATWTFIARAMSTSRVIQTPPCEISANSSKDDL